MAYAGRHSKEYLTSKQNELGAGTEEYRQLGQEVVREPEVKPERVRGNSGSDFYASIGDYIGEIAGQYPDRREQLEALVNNANRLAQETGDYVFVDRNGSPRPDLEPHVRRWIGDAAGRIIDTATGHYDNSSKVLLFETDYIAGSSTLATTNAITELLGAPNHGVAGSGEMNGDHAEKFSKTTELPGVNLISLTVFEDKERKIKQHTKWYLERENGQTQATEVKKARGRLRKLFSRKRAGGQDTQDTTETYLN